MCLGSLLLCPREVKDCRSVCSHTALTLAEKEENRIFAMICSGLVFRGGWGEYIWRGPSCTGLLNAAAVAGCTYQQKAEPDPRWVSTNPC